MKFLVASSTMTPDESRDLAIANGCGGYYMTCPPVWQDQSIADGWTYPCIITMGDDGLVASWTPV
jgi:hypothetical protein